jgi:methylenetetrahydrofolate reductase (NADPH)
MRFSSLCGAEIPKWISKRLEYYQNDLDSLEKFGFEVVSNLCQTLKNQGVEEFHFYSMNKTNPALPLAKALF